MLIFASWLFTFAVLFLWLYFCLLFQCQRSCGVSYSAQGSTVEAIQLRLCVWKVPDSFVVLIGLLHSKHKNWK